MNGPSARPSAAGEHPAFARKGPPLVPNPPGSRPARPRSRRQKASSCRFLRSRPNRCSRKTSPKLRMIAETPETHARQGSQVSTDACTLLSSEQSFHRATVRNESHFHGSNHRTSWRRTASEVGASRIRPRFLPSGDGRIQFTVLPGRLTTFTGVAVSSGWRQMVASAPFSVT